MQSDEVKDLSGFQEGFQRSIKKVIRRLFFTMLQDEVRADMERLSGANFLL